MALEQARAFGQQALAYDQLRPGYPIEAIDDALKLLGLGPHISVADIGAGTGKASVEFARRGMSVCVVEPDSDMLSVALAKLEGTQGVTFHPCTFEAWRPERSTDLLCVAQAWHWLDPPTRVSRVASALAAKGGLLLLWNRQQWPRAAIDIRQRMDQTYLHTAPALSTRARRGPTSLPRDERAAFTELNRAGHWFTPVSNRQYVTRQEYTVDDYLALRFTESEHALLASDLRRRLWTRLRQVMLADASHRLIKINWITTASVYRRTELASSM